MARPRKAPGPKRASSYPELPDDPLLCHARNRHALGWPNVWQRQHPTRGFIAWHQIDECARCGTIVEAWRQVNAYSYIPIGSPRYWHPDGYLMEGGNSGKEAKIELHHRAIAKQGLVLDADGYVVGEQPEAMRREKPKLPRKKRTTAVPRVEPE